MAGIGPESAAIKLTASEEEKISTMSSADEIKDYLAALTVEKGMAVRDIYDPHVLLFSEAATATPQKFARSVIVNGRKHVLEANSELGLAQAEAALFRAALDPNVAAQPTTEKVATEQPRDTATGRFTAAQDVEARAALDLKFQLGQVDVKTYLEQSGAVGEYLQNQGIDPEALRQISGQQFEKSWSQATEEFLHSPAGADWPGGTENLEVIGRLIAENSLMDVPDKAAVLAATFKYAREHQMLGINPETELAQKIASATSHSELAALLGAPERQKARAEAQSSGLFGR